MDSHTYSHAGSYTVVVSNSAGSVTSSAATLTVNSGGGSNTKYNLTGFATVAPGCTGGGVIPTTDPGYRQVSTPLDFATAIRDANKTAGAVKVIEIMNDLSRKAQARGLTPEVLESLLKGA